MSNNFIKHITLENYKSIQKLDLELKPLNVLIGSNGAGKSNFISFFNLLLLIKAGDEIFNNKIFGAYGGVDAVLYFGRKHSKYLDFSLAINDTDYMNDAELYIKLMPTVDNKFYFDMKTVTTDSRYMHLWDMRSSINRPSNEQNSSENYSTINDFLNRLDSIQAYHFNDTSDTSPLKSTVANNDNLFLRADGQNLSCMIKLIYDKHPDYYRMIVDTIRNVVPDFHEFVIRQNSDFLTLEWFNKNNVDIPWKAHYLSDGSLRFIALAVLLLMPSELQPQVIIIDEPEIGLHPTAINVLSGLIKRASLERQVIISTQSAELLSQFEPNDVIVVDKKGKSSEFKRLNNADLAKWLEDYTLGELWETNIIGGRP